jgi:hypothetical protein
MSPARRRPHLVPPRAARSVPIVLGLLLLGLTGALATPTAPAAPSVDPACIRFLDPPAVVHGEVVYTDFTAYDAALDHAVAAWSPARGFAVAWREAAPTGDAVPADATLIYRDATIPGAAFKGVTVTWADAPATITLNRAFLPPPGATDPLDQDLIRAVMTHETGHALGLGDVPAPGVTIRECANMLMKRSVDKAGGRLTEPQAADIALYCLRWGGAICQSVGAPPVAPGPPSTLAPEAPGTSPVPPTPEPVTTYRYIVVTCEQPPAGTITPAQVANDDRSPAADRDCVRAPAGVLFHLRWETGASASALTDRHGEFTVARPDGVGVDVAMPEGRSGWFPSLVGYQPLQSVDRLPPRDPACAPGTECKRVYVLVA